MSTSNNAPIVGLGNEADGETTSSPVLVRSTPLTHQQAETPNASDTLTARRESSSDAVRDQHAPSSTDQHGEQRESEQGESERESERVNESAGGSRQVHVESSGGIAANDSGSGWVTDASFHYRNSSSLLSEAFRPPSEENRGQDENVPEGEDRESSATHRVQSQSSSENRDHDPSAVRSAVTLHASDSALPSVVSPASAANDNNQPARQVQARIDLQRALNNTRRIAEPKPSTPSASSSGATGSARVAS
mmetsp:Transcript_17368/g.53906  ORF Transcript_17368/g.53906 Transcript_17368/m.53906 type:complete len:250 (+) Transcript_17368:298-1047(+)